jgi:hypothetical protein
LRGDRRRKADDSATTLDREFPGPGCTTEAPPVPGGRSSRPVTAADICRRVDSAQHTLPCLSSRSMWYRSRRTGARVALEFQGWAFPSRKYSQSRLDIAKKFRVNCKRSLLLGRTGVNERRQYILALRSNFAILAILDLVRHETKKVARWAFDPQEGHAVS